MWLKRVATVLEAGPRSPGTIRITYGGACQSLAQFTATSPTLTFAGSSPANSPSVSVIFLGIFSLPVGTLVPLNQNSPEVMKLYEIADVGSVVMRI